MDRLNHRSQRWRVGDVQVTRIEEASFTLPVQHLLPQADTDRQHRHARWLSPAQLDAKGMMTLVMCGFVVESRGRRILVDTCIGPEHERGDHSGAFLRRLDAAGYPPASIDAVVCTHVHFDHVGWNTTLLDGVRQPTFTRAEYFFCQDEWTALRDAERVGLLGSVGPNVAWLLDAGRASLVPGMHHFTDEVSLLPTFGHSPGHVAVLVSSGGQGAVITGDSVHHPIQLVDPELVTIADHDPAGAVRSRLTLIDRVVDTGALVLGTHFANPCAVKLKGAGSSLSLCAVDPIGD